MARFAVLFVAVLFFGGNCIAITLETGAEIDHLNHEVQVNQDRILSMGEQYGKEISQVEGKFSKMEESLEKVLSQLSGNSRQLLTLSSDIASLNQAINQNKVAASNAVVKVEQEVKSALNSQQSAVMSLTEQLSELRQSLATFKRDTTGAISNLQTNPDVAGLIEKSPIVQDLTERIKAMESAVMVDPPLADTLKRTSASLGLLQNTLLPAVKDLRTQMAEVQQLVKTNPDN